MKDAEDAKMLAYECDKLMEENVSLRARIAALEAALRPFAECYDPSAHYESAHDVGGSLCLADFEEAHRALVEPGLASLTTSDTSPWVQRI